MSGNRGQRGVTRRDFMKATAGAAALSIGGLGPISKVFSEEPIKIGFVSIFSGRVAMLGETGLKGAQLAADEYNAKGGVLGREIEIIYRDSGGKIEEAVRIARDFAVKDKVDFLMDHSSSRESFAVKEVSRDLKIITMATASETTDHTADPKIRTPYSFRSARQSVHDCCVAGYYAAKLSKELGLTKWYSVSPDYAYGHDSTDRFFEFLQKKNPEVKIAGQLWPKIFEPDYTPHITKMLDDKPQAIYSALWGGDIVAFIEQALMYGLFEVSRFFGINIADYTVLKALKKVPEGLYTGSRYLRNVPDDPANHKFADRYRKKYGELPTNWSWETYSGMLFLLEGIKKAKSFKTEKVINAIQGLRIKAPAGAPDRDGYIEMRSRDHTIIGYAIAWGRTISKEPYVTELYYLPWSELLKEEEEYLRKKGWL
jgi:branched-chain amino acid transport system substrate-binding protein